MGSSSIGPYMAHEEYCEKQTNEDYAFCNICAMYIKSNTICVKCEKNVRDCIVEYSEECIAREIEDCKYQIRIFEKSIADRKRIDELYQWAQVSKKMWEEALRRKKENVPTV